MKKNWKAVAVSVTASVLVACTTMTVVSGVLANKSTTYQFEAPALAAAAATHGVFENSVSVPYGDASAVYTVYVSPDGNNANDGKSLATAVSSVHQAQAMIRDWYSRGNEGDSMILLDDGEYFLNSPVELLQEDMEGGTLYIRSMNANKATISGAKIVDNAQVQEYVDEELGRVWKIPCDQSINQLYVNDTYGVRSRYPNLGVENRLLEMDTVLREFLLDSDDLEGYTAEDFLGATMTIAIMWSESYVRVEGVTVGEEISRVKIVGDDSFVFAREGLTVKPRCGYHFENSMAFLDIEGEWFYAGDEGCVYYLPYDTETLENTTLRIPYTETLLSVEGDLGEKASGLVVEGVNFKYTKNPVVDGKVGGQANRNDNTATKRISGGLNDGRPIAALSFEYASDIVLRGNIFACLGGGAVDFVQGVHNATVEKNMFRTVGGNGILASATSYDITIVSHDERTFIKDVVVENNYFTEIGWQDYDACAIIFNYGVNVLISHNTISNVLYSGISIGWGWVATAYPFLQNIDVTYNRLTNCNALLSDGGPIYAIGCQPGSSITDNYVGESYNSVWKYPEDIPSKDAVQVYWANAGIYLDSNTGSDSLDEPFMVANNYVAKDVNTQQYEDIHAKHGPAEDPEKRDYYKIVPAKESDKEKIFNAAGVQEDGFSLLPEGAVLTGHRTNSASMATVYGYDLGKKTDGALIIRGKDGGFTQVAADDIVTWTDRWISFRSADYSSGEVFLMNKDGSSSNRVFATLNIDKEYSMYGQFEEKWGKDYISTFAKMRARGVTLAGFDCSSTSGIYTADLIGDGYNSTGWEMNSSDTDGAWVSCYMEDRTKVDKFIIYARAEVDQPNCRQNFKVYGLKNDGTEILLYETTEEDVPVYANNGLFILDMAELGHADTVFTGFKIQKKPTEADKYLFIAEVAVIAAGD